MSGHGAPAAVDHAGIGVVLPADWAVVPLADEATRGRAVAEIADDHVGGGDSWAPLRRELRVEVGAAARRAAASGGWVLAFMLRQAGGHPLPATTTGYRARGTLRDTDDVARTRAALERTAGAGEVTVGTGPFGTTLRVVRSRTGAWHGVDGLALLAYDVWTDPDDGHGLVHLSCTTPLVPLRDAFCELFDAIASTLHTVPAPALQDGSRSAATSTS